MTGVNPPLPASVTAVLPAYNESAVIAGVVRRTHGALREAGLGTFEVLVVDDGSRDGTGDEARRVADELGDVRVLTHEKNRGYGAALRTGFDGATSAAVWLLDSDGQFDPADLRLLLAAWEPNVFVAGYRAHRSDSMMRRANHVAFFSLVHALHGATARDVNCAFKLFPRDVGAGLRAHGAVISTELLLRARRRGLRIVEVPIPHYPRLAGTPTGANVRVVLRAFAELRRLDRMVDEGERESDLARAPAPAAATRQD